MQARVRELVDAAPVMFRANSPRLTESGADTVERVAQEMATVPSTRVLVIGYAAPVTTPAMLDPQLLSDRRAAVVARRLVSHGMTAARVRVRGASDGMPLSTPAASRRAEFTVS